MGSYIHTVIAKLFAPNSTSESTLSFTIHQDPIVRLRKSNKKVYNRTVHEFSVGIEYRDANGEIERTRRIDALKLNVSLAQANGNAVPFDVVVANSTDMRLSCRIKFLEHSHYGSSVFCIRFTYRGEATLSLNTPQFVIYAKDERKRKSRPVEQEEVDFSQNSSSLDILDFLARNTSSAPLLPFMFDTQKKLSNLNTPSNTSLDSQSSSSSCCCTTTTTSQDGTLLNQQLMHPRIVELVCSYNAVREECARLRIENKALLEKQNNCALLQEQGGAHSLLIDKKDEFDGWFV